MYNNYIILISAYKLLMKVGISGAPNNAPNYIKKIVDIVTKKNGGNGLAQK